LIPKASGVRDQEAERHFGADVPIGVASYRHGATPHPNFYVHEEAKTMSLIQSIATILGDFIILIVALCAFLWIGNVVLQFVVKLFKGKE
jgi:hypothetical protein